METYSCR